jgi:hypothetical protein
LQKLPSHKGGLVVLNGCISTEVCRYFVTTICLPYVLLQVCVCVCVCARERERVRSRCQLVDHRSNRMCGTPTQSTSHVWQTISQAFQTLFKYRSFVVILSYDEQKEYCVNQRQDIHEIIMKSYCLRQYYFLLYLPTV